MKVKGQQPAKDVKGDSDTFVDFARRLMKVPHSEIKGKLDAEKAAKNRPRPFKRMADLASRAPADSSRKG